MDNMESADTAATIAGSELAFTRWEKLALNQRLEQLKATHAGVKRM